VISPIRRLVPRRAQARQAAKRYVTWRSEAHAGSRRLWRVPRRSSFAGSRVISGIGAFADAARQNAPQARQAMTGTDASMSAAARHETWATTGMQPSARHVGVVAASSTQSWTKSLGRVEAFLLASTATHADEWSADPESLAVGANATCAGWFSVERHVTNACTGAADPATGQ
jgi:hypothetical protein